MAESLDQLVHQIKAFKNKIHAEGKALLEESFKDIFVKHPEIEYITWTQYAPYFNDGEPCEFSVHEPYVKLKGKVYEGHRYWDLDSNYSFRDTKPDLYKDLDKLYDAFQACEDVMRAAFGDDSQVKVYGFPDFRIETEHYDHD